MSLKLLRLTAQGCLLTFISNIVAQAITSYRQNSSFFIAWKPIFEFILWSIISTPPNFLWQEYLEYLLPGHTAVSSKPSHEGVSKEKSLAATSSSAKPNEKSPVAAQLNVRNTILKFCIDQSLCASINTLGYSCYMAAAKGASTPQAWQIAKHDFWGLLTAGWKLWPWVSLANYSIIKSVEGRALVGNLAGFVWGIYLSLTSASK